MSSRRRQSSRELRINLALQGGGSHGAFAWGVLDRLLEEEWLSIESITGTSAGAMNAVVLADGYLRDGRNGAKAALKRFWTRVSDAAQYSPIRRTPFDTLMGNWGLNHSPGYFFFDLFSRIFSPYQVNPLNINPLRDILQEIVDFRQLREAPLKLFITATNVRTGLPRVFRNGGVTVDAVLASACLPLMHQTIEIEGEGYWDGGFSGNPLLTPVIRESESHDILLVQVNPIERPGIPHMAHEILNRINEISFNSSLKKELRMISMLRRMLAEKELHTNTGWIGHWTKTRLHRISSPQLVKFGASSKLNAEWEFLIMLHAEGRRCADEFLSNHTDDLGHRSTFPFDSLLDTILEQV
jgi:NTE family protein